VKEEDDMGNTMKKEKSIENDSEQVVRMKEEIAGKIQARDQETEQKVWIKEEDVDEDVCIKEEEEEVAFVSEKQVGHKTGRRK
jgi:hypothetical protein